MIKIIQEDEVQVTAGDLARYKQEYRQAFAFYCGPIVTLEEYIRRKQNERQV